MDINGFKKLLDEFLVAFNHVKPLYKKIRGILFSLLKDGALFTKTISDISKELYHPIIKAFKDAVEDIPTG